MAPSCPSRTHDRPERRAEADSRGHVVDPGVDEHEPPGPDVEEDNARGQHAPDAQDFTHMSAPERPLRPGIAVVHVGHDQPATFATLAQRKRELADVGLTLLPRKAPDDVAHRALRREGQGTQRQGPALAYVVLLDLEATSDRRNAAGKDESVLGEQGGERGGILVPPGRFIIGEDACQRRGQLDPRPLRRVRRQGTGSPEQEQGSREKQDRLTQHGSPRCAWEKKPHAYGHQIRDERTCDGDAHKSARLCTEKGVQEISHEIDGEQTEGGRMAHLRAACHELRIKNARNDWRIVYRVDADAVVIADIFAKATRKTPDRIIADCSRLRMYDEATQGGANPMKKDKKTRLERAGWKIGTVRELLGLSKAEEALVELKLILSHGLRERRARRKLTQAQLARLLKSSQSRVAKMEAGNPSVSIDLLIRSLFAMGATQRELAQVIAHKIK